MISIGDIKIELALTKDEMLPLFIGKYADDERGGVISLVASAEKRLVKYNAELERTHKMYEYERQFPDIEYIAGIDEVGRGPLAGPVVTCSLILPKDRELLYLNDSKKLSAAKRDELFDILTEESIDFSIGIVDNNMIDEINILQATYEAMRNAIDGMNVKPQQLLCDAVTIPKVSIPQLPIIKGDAKSASIAAASIVAKVTRDRMMDEFDKLYPEYNFASNKGYGTKEHIEALKKYGPCPIHRRSFITAFC